MGTLSWWSVGEPNNSGEDQCGVVYTNGKFNDIYCDNTRPFLCDMWGTTASPSDCVSHGCDVSMICDQATGQCMRDCDALHIDAFLTQCSAEWDENNDTLVAMSASIADNAADIATVNATTASNAADIAANAAEVSTNMTALKAQIEA